MRQSFSTDGKTKAELAKMVADLASRIYRLEREKSLLRRTLVAIGQGIANHDLSAFHRRAKELIESVLSKTDARRKKPA